MVIDDDEDLLEMICYGLRAQGFKVTCLRDDYNITNAIEEYKPEVLILDIYLENQDGRDICKELKLNDKYRNLPIILYSAGNISDESVRDCSADYFLSKPFDISNLSKKIKELKNLKSIN